MKTLYIECTMGASGDMLTAALCGLLDDPNELIKEINSLGLPGVRAELETKKQYGVTGLHVSVRVHGIDEGEEPYEHHHSHEHHHHHDHGHHHHHHSHTHEHPEHSHTHEHHEHGSFRDIREILAGLPVSERVKRDAAAVYHLIAQAEAKVHGESVELVHFHEVGALDAVADVTAVCLLMEKLGVDGFVISPVHVGNGTVKCAHGVLPVPAPATAELLQGLDCYGGDVQGELCTPTGAALLRYFARGCGPMPAMQVEKIGVGIGTKDFGRCNCLRAFLGESKAVGDQIEELCCNVDDMTGEELGFAMEQLLEAGAVDAFFTPIYMKKNRPAYMLTCLCREEQCEAVTAALFRHTTTLGVRRHSCTRSVLGRREHVAETSLGAVRVKHAEGFGVKRVKVEYEDRKRIAQERQMSLAEVAETLEKEL